MVYCHCLFVGEVFPYYDFHCLNDRPLRCVSLLRTCKAINLEAEPVLYRNTFVLSSVKAVQQLFDITLSTPARKLLLKSVELSLEGDNSCPVYCWPYFNQDFALEDVQSEVVQRVADTLDSLTKSICGEGGSKSNLEDHLLRKAVLLDAIWPLQIDPILDSLALDRLVLGMTECFRDPKCRYKMEASTIMCFREGFALQAPKVVEIKWWRDAGRADIDAVVLECFQLWTAERAGRRVGAVCMAPNVVSEAQSWLLEAVRKEKQEESIQM